MVRVSDAINYETKSRWTREGLLKLVKDYLISCNLAASKLSAWPREITASTPTNDKIARYLDNITNQLAAGTIHRA